MTISRRAFLVGAAAAPVVAAVPAAQAKATVVGEMFAPAVVVEDKFPFSFWIGDGERFHSSCGTLEEAISIAKEYGVQAVLKARPQEVKWKVSKREIVYMIERMHEDAEEKYGDPEGWDADIILGETPDQLDELVGEMSAVFDAWLARHNLRTMAWQFDPKGQELFDVPREQDVEVT